MSIITLPAGLLFAVGLGVGQARYDLVETSDVTGAEQTRLLGPPRWRITLVAPQSMRWAEGSQWEALVLRLRGSVNRLAAHDPMRPAPRGSMRGAPTLAAAAAAGASSLSLTGTTGTLQAGDWLQIGTGIGTSQLVKVVADAASLAGVQFEPPLRRAYAAGTVVTWDKPVAYYRLVDQAPSWRYPCNGLGAGGFVLDLLEAWS